MKTQKMSLANMQGKLSRSEMKSIMAGSGSTCAFGAWGDYMCSSTYGAGYICIYMNGGFYCSHP